MKKVIDKFADENFFLSNFYPSPFMHDGYMWPTVEHYYQAHKTINMPDFKLIAEAPTAGKAKRLGAKVELREDWEGVKDQIMLRGLILKFGTHDDLITKILATNEAELVEGNNWHDNYWGDCSCEKCKKIEGKNELGKLLMYVRDIHNPFLNI